MSGGSEPPDRSRETIDPYRDCPEIGGEVVRRCRGRGSFDRVV